MATCNAAAEVSDVSCHKNKRDAEYLRQGFSAFDTQDSKPDVLQSPTLKQDLRYAVWPVTKKIMQAMLYLEA